MKQLPEMWDPPTEPGAFALPGDEERYGTGQQAEEGTAAPEETPAEETAQQERARDEQGRFTATTEEEEAPAEPDDPALAWARERFGDEVTPKVAKALWEKEQFLQRQGTEIGELRKAVQELPGQIQQQTPQALPNYDYDSLIEQNPAQAAQLAYDSGDVVRMQQAIGAWEELSPGTPTVWAQNLQLQEQMRAQQEAFEARLGPVQETAARNVAEQAMRDFARTHPDLDQYREQMVTVAEQSPHLAPLLESTDPGAKMQVLDYLYTKAKGEQARGTADNLAQALRTTAQDVARAEGEAAVVSTSQRTTEPEPPSLAEQIAQPWRDRQQPFEDGWNIQSG